MTYTTQLKTESSKLSRNHNEYISILKAMACLFITNSHCPYPVPFLQIGGGWGNTLFFAVSGFCLANISLPFFRWIKRRYSKILPITAIMLLVSWFISGRPSNILSFCVSKFWFISAIMLFYPIYYCIAKSGKFKLFFILHGLGYCIFYLISDRTHFFVELSGFSPFKVYFYFGVMILGGYIVSRQETLGNNSCIYTLLLAAVGLVTWGIEYMMIKLFNAWFEIQFLIHIGMLIFATGMMLTAINLNNKYQIPNKFTKKLELISDSTLEIYLVQITLLPLINKLVFPVNMLIFWVSAILGGIVLHRIRPLVATWKNKGDKSSK